MFIPQNHTTLNDIFSGLVRIITQNVYRNVNNIVKNDPSLANIWKVTYTFKEVGTGNYTGQVCFDLKIPKSEIVCGPTSMGIDVWFDHEGLQTIIYDDEMETERNVDFTYENTIEEICNQVTQEVDNLLCCY